MVAMHFNSMAIGVGKELISTVVRQGWASSKYSAYTRLYVAKSRFMFTKKTVTSTKFSHLLQEASSTAFTLSKTDRHCASKSNSRKFPLWSSFKPGTPLSFESEPAVRGPTPDKKSKLPTLRACGYEPTGFGALAALIFPEVDMFDWFGSKVSESA